MNWKGLAMRALPFVVFGTIAVAHYVLMGFCVRIDL